MEIFFPRPVENKKGCGSGFVVVSLSSFAYPFSFSLAAFTLSSLIVIFFPLPVENKQGSASLAGGASLSSLFAYPFSFSLAAFILSSLIAILFPPPVENKLVSLSSPFA